MIQLAKRHPATKFMRIVATNCVENFPDSAVPTVLIYHEGDNKKRLTGVEAFGARALDVNCTQPEGGCFVCGSATS